MFYSTQLLDSKTPLGLIWLAAHYEKKLQRRQVFEVDLENSVDSILLSEVPLALRLSGQLLLGVVRIYARKVSYLFADANDVLSHIRQAYAKEAPSHVDLAHPTAPHHHITLDFTQPLDLYPGLDHVPTSFDLVEADEFYTQALAGAAQLAPEALAPVPLPSVGFGSSGFAGNEFEVSGPDMSDLGLDVAMPGTPSYGPVEVERLRAVTDAATPGGAIAADLFQAGLAPTPGKTPADEGVATEAPRRSTRLTGTGLSQPGGTPADAADLDALFALGDGQAAWGGPTPGREDDAMEGMRDAQAPAGPVEGTHLTPKKAARHQAPPLTPSAEARAAIFGKRRRLAVDGVDRIPANVYQQHLKNRAEILTDRGASRTMGVPLATPLLLCAADVDTLPWDAAIDAPSFAVAGGVAFEDAAALFTSKSLVRPRTAAVPRGVAAAAGEDGAAGPLRREPSVGREAREPAGPAEEEREGTGRGVGDGERSEKERDIAMMEEDGFGRASLPWSLGDGGFASQGEWRTTAEGLGSEGGVGQSRPSEGPGTDVRLRSVGPSGSLPEASPSQAHWRQGPVGLGPLPLRRVSAGSVGDGSERDLRGALDMADEDMGDAGAAQAAAGVTRRTRRVLSFLQRQFAEAEASAPPAKQRRGAGAASPVAAFQGVPLGPLLHGKTRAEASRMFYEVLVLNSRGLVAAQQGESFGEITLMPGKALIAGS